MTTNGKNGQGITITASDMELLAAAKARREQQRVYRAARRERVDVKEKEREVHAARNARLVAFDAAFRYLLCNGKITNDTLQELISNVDKFEAYSAEYAEKFDELTSACK